MRRMWSDLLSWIVGGLMSSSTHAASFCLPICAASLRFQHTYMCFNSLCLLFDLPHLLLGHLQNIFKAPCLLHASGLWKKGKENSCTNNRCVLWSQAATSILKEWYVPSLWHKLTKYVEKRGGEMVFVFKLWHISPPSCVGGLMAPEIWNGFSNFILFF